MPAGGAYVTTLPSGADVFVDGVYVGRSPALVGGLGRGHHAVTLTKNGWAVQEIDVTVAAGSIVMSSTRLLPGPRALSDDPSGTLALRSTPPSAMLTLDGHALSASPDPIAVAAGSHVITMTTARGRTTRRVDVLPAMTTQLVLQEPKADEERTAVVAPAEDYLPTDDFSVAGKKVIVRYSGHVVVGRIGDPTLRYDRATTTFDAAPDMIAGRLYLPLLLLEKLTGDTSK